MMYLMLIYKDDEKLANATPEEKAALGKGYGELNAFLAENKNLNRGTATWPANITTVRIRNGETVTADAPCVGTGERIGGFFLIKAENIEAAIKVAERVPHARYGAVEIRPVQV